MCAEFALLAGECSLDCMDLHHAGAMLARSGEKTYLEPLYGLGMVIEVWNIVSLYMVSIHIYDFIHIKYVHMITCARIIF